MSRRRRKTPVRFGLPSITKGLTFVSHLNRHERPFLSAAGTTAFSTETVDADRVALPWHGNLLVAGTANAAFFTRDGVLSEVASTNHAIYSEDMSNAAWAKSNVAVDTDSHADPAGAANTKCEVRATAANGTLLQTVTIASAAYRFSVYLKRKTGSGNVDITIDNGGTWTTQTISSTAWTRCDIGKTAANPIFGIRIVTSGDEVLMTFAQLEAQLAPTSYIPTTSGAVTRAADDLAYASTGNVSKTAGTIIIAVTPRAAAANLGAGSIVDIGASADRLLLWFNNSTDKWAWQVRGGGSTTAALESSSGPVKDTPCVLTACWAANDARLYTNGADEKSDTSVTVPANLPSDIDLAQFYNTPGDIGSKKHLLIYDRSLSAGEIERIVRVDYQRWMPDYSV